MAVSIRIILFFICLIWLIGIISPLTAGSSQSESYMGIFLDGFYSLVCHTDPVKLLCADMGCTLVCARCFGIYLGAVILSFVTIFAKRVDIKSLRLLYIISAIMLIDVIAYNIGVYDYNKTIAVITGVFFGSGTFLYIGSGLEKLLEELFKK